MENEKIIASAVLLGGLAWWMLSRTARAAVPDEDYSIGDGFAWDFLNVSPPGAEPDKRADNMSAFLKTIRWAEGTSGANGYSVQYGGSTFDGFGAHPNKVISAGGIKSSAAGAYQFLSSTWSDLQRQLGLTDFSPASQDAAAVELIKRAGALDDVNAGRFDAAARKVRKTWASFPGAGYGQPEKKMSELRSVYEKNGGGYG